MKPVKINTSSDTCIGLSKQLHSSGVASFSWEHPQELHELAKHLGEVIADPLTGDVIRDLRPESFDQANPNTLSSRFGLGAFPFHTEIAYLRPSPRFLLLACENPGFGRRTTRLLDATPLILELSKLRRRGVWMVQAGRGPFLTQLILNKNGEQGIYYDPACYRPSGATAHIEQSIVNKFIANSSPLEVEWNAYEGIIIDNRRMLHARGIAQISDGERLLKRILIR